MSKQEILEAIVKAESHFYAALEECPKVVFLTTPGIKKEKDNMGTFVRISKEILNPHSLFYRYLMYPGSYQIFGTRHPLYGKSAIKYDEQERPTEINHFTTRLLLSFFEVQLGLGFSGFSFQKHQQAIETILSGEESEIEVNYYHPFNHQDNIGYHWIYGSDGKGGYDSQDWRVFLDYPKGILTLAYKLSPEDFGGASDGLERAVEQFTYLVFEPYQKENKINMFPLRHWEKIVNYIFQRHGIKNELLIPHPVTGEMIPYFPLVSYLLDMPYRNGAIVVFQSTCGEK